MVPEARRGQAARSARYTSPAGELTAADRAPVVGGAASSARSSRGRSRRDFVLDTPTVVAFLDHRPLFPGHTLVDAARRTSRPCATSPAPLRDELFAQIQRWRPRCRTPRAAQGSFVAMNNVVSQSVPHLHVHAVPRNRKDGLRGFFWPRTRTPSEDAAEAVAAAIRGRVALDATM